MRVDNTLHIMWYADVFFWSCLEGSRIVRTLVVSHRTLRHQCAPSHCEGELSKVNIFPTCLLTDSGCMGVPDSVPWAEITHTETWKKKTDGLLLSEEEYPRFSLHVIALGWQCPSLTRWWTTAIRLRNQEQNEPCHVYRLDSHDFYRPPVV